MKKILVIMLCVFILTCSAACNIIYLPSGLQITESVTDENQEGTGTNTNDENTNVLIVFKEYLQSNYLNKSCRFALVDMNGDGITEIVLEKGLEDVFVLRYYEGEIICYRFTFRSMYYVCEDGTYCWNYTGQDGHWYGEAKLSFNDRNYKTTELYSINNDGQPDAKYYLNGKEATQQDVMDYTETLNSPRVPLYDLNEENIEKVMSNN